MHTMNDTRTANAKSESAESHREKTERTETDLHAVAAAKEVVEKAAFFWFFAPAFWTVLGKLTVLLLGVCGGVGRRVARRR